MTAQRPINHLPPAPAPSAGGSTGLASVRTLARDAFGREIVQPEQQPNQPPTQPFDPLANGDDGKPRREAATESIGRRAGALSDELDFPEFVATLVHGTFDAIVDSSIRQMESFADLVSAVAKPIDQFTQENVTPNQARDWLVEQYPRDLAMARDAESFRVVPRVLPGSDSEPQSPDWLDDFGFSGEELTPEFVEEQLLPLARERVARNRLQTLATMVLLGMNRVVVKDGTIAARLRFRAAAADQAKVDYAVSDDPGGGSAEWGQRGSRTYSVPSVKVSTVGVNVQSDSELKAELFGEVKINFASETVPLDRFVDEAKRTLLERHARSSSAAPARPALVAPPATTPAATAPIASLPTVPTTPSPETAPLPPSTTGGRQ